GAASAAQPGWSKPAFAKRAKLDNERLRKSKQRSMIDLEVIMDHDQKAGDEGFGEWHDMRGFFRRFDRVILELKRIAHASERIAHALEKTDIDNAQIYLELTQHVAKLKNLG